MHGAIGIERGEDLVSLRAYDFFSSIVDACKHTERVDVKTKSKSKYIVFCCWQVNCIVATDVAKPENAKWIACTSGAFGARYRQAAVKWIVQSFAGTSDVPWALAIKLLTEG